MNRGARLLLLALLVVSPAIVAGAADASRAELQELYEHVKQQVTTKSRVVGGNQHPVMKGELEGGLLLAKVRSR